jgi:deoxyribose-phosphate aldolase
MEFVEMTTDVVRARRAIALIDLTDLADDRSPSGIPALYERAVEHGTAAVCVWPEFVDTCIGLLDGSGVRVATVVNFPEGTAAVSDVVMTTTRALDDGADEIDLVLPYQALATGTVDEPAVMINAVRRAIVAPAELKVILETGVLSDHPGDLVAVAARMAIAEGADFVKTSTGKVAVGATLDAVATMLDVIAATDRHVGIKPSGRISTFESAMAYLDLAESVMGEGWATPATFRFGASSLLDALLAVARGV